MNRWRLCRGELAVVPPRAAGEQLASAHTERGLRLAELILAMSREPRARLCASAAHPEPQASLDLGVTRSSARTALALLEAQGHISREVGRGTFLRALPQPTAAGAGDAAGQISPIRAVAPSSAVSPLPTR